MKSLHSWGRDENRVKTREALFDSWSQDDPFTAAQKVLITIFFLFYKRELKRGCLTL